MNRPRAKGTAYETAVTAYLRSCGWPHAERRALHGNHDRGDITGIIGWVLEVKAAKDFKLSEWAAELDAAKANDSTELGALWIKRPRHPHPSEAYIVLDGHTFTRLLKEAGY